MAPRRKFVDDFGSIYRRAITAQADVRATFNRELPKGEGLTLGTIGESIDQLEVFLARIGFLVANGLRPLAAPPPNPRGSRANLNVLTEPLRNAVAKYRSAQVIMSNLHGLNCTSPVETVTRLGTAIQQAIALADRL
jgi:hypothetical protein